MILNRYFSDLRLTTLACGLMFGLNVSAEGIHNMTMTLQSPEFTHQGDMPRR